MNNKTLKIKKTAYLQINLCSMALNKNVELALNRDSLVRKYH